MSKETDPLMIAAVAVVGFMLLSRPRTAAAGTAAQYNPRGPSSMPGSVGTGTTQLVGGLLGALASHIPEWVNGSSGSAAPYANVPPVLQDTVPLTGDAMETDPFENFYAGMA
ncbi:hypothetical protein [Pseudoduganella aquatica]|uniref:hypothetical protein n=1 Tax=Pseudoduganella aquatica TaxID=2660641 RepID=UPI001E36E19A|nr:hypothetical protein [Pseudoduganella aquatica]